MSWCDRRTNLANQRINKQTVSVLTAVVQWLWQATITGIKFAFYCAEDSMAHNEQENKKPQGGGPQAHPSNHGPSKRAGGDAHNAPGPGGNKVGQGRGSDTGNKGKS
jgi:hypothetical protein